MNTVELAMSMLYMEYEKYQRGSGRFRHLPGGMSLGQWIEYVLNMENE